MKVVSWWKHQRRTFAGFFSLNLSNKSLRWSSVKMKFESLKTTKANLRKKMSQVRLLGISRTTTILHNFWAAILLWSYSCKKSIINHYYDKVKQRFSTQKHFTHNLIIVNEKKTIAEKARKKQLLLFESFKYLTQKAKTYTMLPAVNLKQDVKSVKS